MPVSPPSPEITQPARVLGPIDATCVVIGAIIGVGIFFNPQQVAELTRSAPLSLAAWAIAGGIALCGSLTFAALGGRYQANGAQYQVLRDSYGPLPAFLFVFCNATAIQAGAVAVIAVICTSNLAAAAGVRIPDGAPKLAVAGTLILLLMLANVVGVRWGARVQNFTVYAKIATLVVISLLAVWTSGQGKGAPRVEPEPGPLRPAAAVTAALVPCLFAYGGWQHALWISGEVKDPSRNLPRAIVGGVVLVVAVYLLANWAYLSLLGVEGVRQSQTLAADAVAVVWPQWGRRLIAAAVGVSALGVLNAQLLSGPRLIYGMAVDGRFFAPFARLSPSFGTPVASILLIAIMALALLAATLLTVTGRHAVDLLATGAVFVDGIFFVMTGAAVFVLRRRGEATLRVAGYPLVPALFVLGELGVVVGAQLDQSKLVASGVGAGWIVLATALYVVRFRERPPTA